MIKTATYRFTARLLCWCILLGFAMPATAHGMSMEECTSADAVHASHMKTMADEEDCPMAGQHGDAHPAVMEANANNFGFACACSIEKDMVQTDAMVLQKVNVHILAIVKEHHEDHSILALNDAAVIHDSEPYSHPPIYLSNEALLI